MTQLIGVRISDPVPFMSIYSKIGQPAEKCEFPECPVTVGIFWESSRTMYNKGLDDDGNVIDDEESNRPIAYCREHAEMHHEYWDEMWSNVSHG